jgi:hypothetical protein
MSGIIFEQQKKQPRQNTEKTKRKGGDTGLNEQVTKPIQPAILLLDLTGNN